MGTVISRHAADHIAAAAKAAAPIECCGLLLCDSSGTLIGALAARNVATDPARVFEIDPAMLIATHRRARDGGPQIAGCYHSHPSGDLTPSEADAAQAEPNGWIWIIASSDGALLKGWRAVEHGPLHGRFSAEMLRIVP